MAPRQIIYPLFLAQAGCPFRCVYCDQTQSVTADPQGVGGSAWVERVHALARCARERHRPGEFACYGGTFTRLPRALMTAILTVARDQVEGGAFTGIRFSTRPDALTSEILEALAPYPITTIELGVQSLSDRVLAASRRGYSAATVGRAVARVKERGYRLGIQLMIGLPGESAADFRATVADTLALAPDLVRIYPTLVLTGTVLADWYADGRYAPLTLEQALDRACDAYAAFRRAGIAVARMGLHADPQLARPGVVTAGPYHPAFGYLVKVLWWRRRLTEALADRRGDQADLVLRVPTRQLSEVLGARRGNLEQLRRHLDMPRLEVKSDPKLAADHWRLEGKGLNAAVCGFEEAV